MTEKQRKAQAMAALREANRVRCAGAALKREISAMSRVDGFTRVAAVICRPDNFEGAASVHIDDLLCSVRRAGRSIDMPKIFARAQLAAGRRSKPLRELADTERLRLAESVLVSRDLALGYLAEKERQQRSRELLVAV